MPSSSTVILMIFAIIATLIGAAAGVLAWLGGMNPPTAMLTGGGAFSGTFFLLLTMAQFAKD